MHNKAARNASTQPAAGGYISLSLVSVHDEGAREVPAATETNKRIGRGSAPRGASCSSIDPADYPVAVDSDRRDERDPSASTENACVPALKRAGSTGGLRAVSGTASYTQGSTGGHAGSGRFVYAPTCTTAAVRASAFDLLPIANGLSGSLVHGLKFEFTFSPWTKVLFGYLN